MSSITDMSTIAVPENFEKYVLLTDFGKAGGHNNEGISLVQNTKTGEKFICKEIVARKAKPELIASQRMNGFDHIIQLRDHIPSQLNKLDSLGEDIHHHKLYFEHCDLGSLTNLLKRHEVEQQRIPESFIWHVLLSMAKALQACHAGPKKSEKWVPIAHRDVMAGNILFSSSSNTNTDRFPRVLLSDFGASIEYQLPDSMLQRKDIGDLAESIYDMCFCAWDVENAKLGYSEELQGVLAVMDVYWEDSPEQTAKFNSGFVSWVEESALSQLKSSQPIGSGQR